MFVRCDRCAALAGACGECVLSAVVGAPPGGLHLDDAEWRALEALADAGLVPRRRRVRVRGPGEPLPGADRWGGGTGGDRSPIPRAA